MKFSQYPSWVLQFAKYLLILWCWAINWHIISESVSLILERKCGSFQMHRDNATLIACICMWCRHVLCLPHTIQVWGIVYLCSGYAKCLLSDKRTTPHFLFLLASHWGVVWLKRYDTSYLKSIIFILGMWWYGYWFWGRFCLPLKINPIKICF